MIELLRLLLATLICALWTQQRLLLENLLPRQQLQVALRGQRRPRLRTWDKLFWLGVRFSTGTGDATSFWSGPRPCCACIARAGAYSGAGGPVALRADRG